MVRRTIDRGRDRDLGNLDRLLETVPPFSQIINSERDALKK